MSVLQRVDQVYPGNNIEIPQPLILDCSTRSSFFFGNSVLAFMLWHMRRDRMSQ